jgi:hypothetical protein
MAMINAAKRINSLLSLLNIFEIILFIVYLPN